MAKIKRIFYLLIGDPRQNSLEHRLFNTIALFNAISNIAGSFNVFSNAAWTLFALNLGTGILFGIFYYFSRVRSIYRALYWPFMLLIGGFLFVNMLGNAASLGGAHYYFVPALVIGMILSTRKIDTVLCFLLFVFLTSIVFYLEYIESPYITGMMMREERILDVSGQYIFVQIFTGALVLILKNHFNDERHKSERLLLNILPQAIAEELKKTDHVEPEQYPSATVLFTDMVGFTRIAANMTPHDLIEELDYCFRMFDQIVERRNLEKIKTIGDAYMAVGGVPRANVTHAYDTVMAALDIKWFMDKTRKERLDAGKPFWELRIGIHTGHLVAGVIGEKKFVYDVWGDTVNTASRLESAGDPGRVNISSTTYEIIKDRFYCEPRGKVPVKNKGEIDMYFVNGARSNLS